MLRYLLDTNIVTKGDQGGTPTWRASVDDNTLALNALTIFEISRGIQLKRDEGKAGLVDELEEDLALLRAGFDGRILPMDEDTAEAWGRIAGPKTQIKEWMDRGLIATAHKHGLVLVTHNSKDMKGRGVPVLNPMGKIPSQWDASGAVIKSVAPPKSAAEQTATLRRPACVQQPDKVARHDRGPSIQLAPRQMSNVRR